VRPVSLCCSHELFPQAGSVRECPGGMNNRVWPQNRQGRYTPSGATAGRGLRGRHFSCTSVGWE
jgi:hypothetical protein